MLTFQINGYRAWNKMKLCILHISDLHRDPANPLGNSMLLHSLESDRNRYTSQEKTCIRRPDLIVVSGDIVQGVKHDSSDAESRLRGQYDEALCFLDDLTDRFVGGDKRFIVIVPGNHDVSDYHFRRSLKCIDVEPGVNTDLVEQLFRPHSPLRWSWKEFTLYEVSDLDMYKRRFDAFATFYDKFYEGQRSYSTNSEEQIDIFDFPDWDVSVAGFSSCHNNDLLNRQGGIHPDCIAEAGNYFRSHLYQSRLRIAVWHHSIEGPPMKVDYMDPEMVQNFIDSGFSLGFHGHQHRPEFLNSRFRHGVDRGITVISAGTLCGNAAYGFRRAYNLVEIDTDTRSGRLFVREMQNDSLQMPIWGPRLMRSEHEHFLEFKFDAPPDSLIDFNKNMEMLREAQQLYENCRYREASQLLSQLATTEELARLLFLNCLVELTDMPGIVENFDPPASSAEAIALMDALWIEYRHARLREILNSPLVKESKDSAVIEMREKYVARLER